LVSRHVRATRRAPSYYNATFPTTRIIAIIYRCYCRRSISILGIPLDNHYAAQCEENAGRAIKSFHCRKESSNARISEEKTRRRKDYQHGERGETEAAEEEFGKGRT
jgi:hypothetical protein